MAMRLVLCGLLGSAALAGSQANLKIVVIEGEGAVNIIQQKTAVAPIIEVRDRNDQPVAGAIVTFTIRSGGASFGGGQTLTVTTNAAGRAVAAGLTPSSTGPLSVSASAAFQGETASAMIAQANVMTAPEAAAAAATAGAATGAGGGLSATTIGLIGGVAAGGALAASRVTKSDPEPQTELRDFNAQYSGQISISFGSCANIHGVNGTVAVRVTFNAGVVVSATASMVENRTIADTTCSDRSLVGSSLPLQIPSVAVTTLPKADFSTSFSNTYSTQTNAGNVNYTWTFEGSMNGANTEITGTLTNRVVNNQTSPTPVTPLGTGVTVFPMTLRY